MNLHRILPGLLLLLTAADVSAQDATIQDCLGAIPVCQQIYVEELSPSGDGNINNEINTAISCTAGELNSIWYTFTVDQDGDFGFLIIPNDPDDDYDWCLFDLTNAECSDIFTDQSLIVSCNAAGGIGCHGPTGANGDSNYDIQGAGCNFFPPDINFGDSPFNDLVPVQAGNTYVLMVSNWSGSPNGYTLDLGLGNVTVFDNEDPFVEDVSLPDDCNETEISITFSENIQCSTLDAGNFEVLGPSGPLGFTLDAGDCDSGGSFEDEFVLTLDEPIFELGDYTVNLLVDNTTQGLDLCDNPSAPLSFPFTIDEALALNVELGPADTILCLGDTLFLDATNPIADYEWQDGSDQPVYTVTQSGTYNVEVTNSCGTQSDQIDVTFVDGPPVVEFGADTFLCADNTLTLDAENPLTTYEWQDGSNLAFYNVSAEGTYSVEATNVCGTTFDEIFVNVVPALSLDLPAEFFLCNGDTALLDVTNAEASYLWSTGEAGPIIEVSNEDVYSVTVSTLCETVSDTTEIFLLDETPYDLGPDSLACPGDTLELGQEIPGATYQWQNNSTDPFFTVTQSGTYRVTVSDACSTREDSIRVDFIAPIETELGEDLYLCENQVYLDATTPGLANYEWQDGTIFPFLIAREPGIYTVRVYNQCEEVTDQIELFECELCEVYYPNIFSPNLDGRNDVFRPFSDCPLEDFSMRVYDRWGGLMFDSSDPTEGWDGTFRGEAVANGVYVWRMEFTVTENLLPREVIATGSVTVLR